MGANVRGQGTGRTEHAIVPGIVLLVLMPGFSGTDAQQQHDGEQRNDTGEGCTGHIVKQAMTAENRPLYAARRR